MRRTAAAGTAALAVDGVGLVGAEGARGYAGRRRPRPSEPPYVIPADRPLLEAINASARPEHCIHWELLPEPFLGDPQAPVLLLSLNPEALVHTPAANANRWVSGCRGIAAEPAALTAVTDVTAQIDTRAVAERLTWRTFTLSARRAAASTILQVCPGAWPRPGISPCPWSDATSARDPCSATTPPRLGAEAADNDGSRLRSVRPR